MIKNTTLQTIVIVYFITNNDATRLFIAKSYMPILHFRNECKEQFERMCQFYEIFSLQEVCHTKYRKRKCQTLYQDHCFECDDIYLTKCKDWICNEVKETQCNPVPFTDGFIIQNSRNIKCDKVAYEDCQDEEPFEKCDYVMTDQCKNGPDCKKVPLFGCQSTQQLVPLIPVTRTQQRSLLICQNGKGEGESLQFIDNDFGLLEHKLYVFLLSKA